jgi:hypothetical protein
MTTKVVYRIGQTEDGFPPIQVELLNATAIAQTVFRIDNAPLFATDVSYGDIVRAIPSSVEGQFDFVEVVEGSTLTSLFDNPVDGGAG